MVNTTQTQVVVQEFSQVTNATTAIAQGGDHDNITFVGIPTAMHPIDQGNYTVGLGAYRAFQSYLGHTFNGSLTQQEGGTKIVDSNVVMEAIWSSAGDLDQWIKTVARSLTNAIRADEDGNLQFDADAKDFYGQAYVLGYYVRWPWIVLPVVLVI